MPKINIKIEHVSKKYRLGTINTGMLTRDIQSWLACKMGRPDPNTVIGDGIHSQEDLQQREILALNNISFEVEQGEVMGIVGANGAGKSTLLKILARVTAPTSGVVNIKGRVGSLLEVGTGFHPELTGEENIFLNGAILGMKKKEIKGKLDEIIAFSGVEKYINTPVKRYSSGMRVRLAFAVAAHLEPEILVIDEVLAVGDAEFQKRCIGRMGDLSKNEGRTVLFVSHNMAAVKTLCSRGVLLENGNVSKIGMIDDIVDTYLNSRTPTKKDNIVTESDHLIRQDEIVLYMVNYRNAQGKLVSCFNIFEKYKMELCFKIGKYFSDYRVGIIINDVLGTTLMSFVDEDLSFSRLDADTDECCLMAEFYNILSPGQYSVTINIKRGGCLIDEIMAPCFTVSTVCKGKQRPHTGLAQGQVEFRVESI